MISLDMAFDEYALETIYNKKFSRIPVYDGERSNIVGKIYLKDFLMLKPKGVTYYLKP